MKSLFKLLMIKLEELQEKNFIIIIIENQLKSQNQRDVCATRESFLQHNLLYYFHILYVSDETVMKTKILRIRYDDFLIKHFEIKKIRSLLQRKFYWFRMLKDKKKYIQSCNVCQCVKAFRHRFYNETMLFFILVHL